MKINLRHSIITGLLLAVIAVIFTVIAYYIPLINAEEANFGSDLFGGISDISESDLSGGTVIIPDESSLGDVSTWTNAHVLDTAVSEEVAQEESFGEGNIFEYTYMNDQGDVAFTNGTVIEDTSGGDLTWEDVYESPAVDYNELANSLGDTTFSNLSVGDVLTENQFNELAQAANGGIPGLSQAAQQAAQLAIQSITQSNGKYTLGNPSGGGVANGTFGSTLPEWIKGFYGWAVGIAGLLATAVLIYAGYLYATSAGNPEQVNLAKEYVIGALSGLAFLLLAVIIYNAIKVNESGGGGQISPTPTTPIEQTPETTPLPGAPETPPA